MFIAALFAHLPHRTRSFLFAPAILSSIVAGGIAPFMTYVVGQSFAAFAAFPLPPVVPTDAQKHALLSGVGLAALELLALGLAALLMGAGTSALWISLGEHNAAAWRKKVYAAVTSRDMTWFDSNVNPDGDAHQDNNASVGAGGLMAKFAKDTDDIRTASALSTGLLLQHLTTTLTALLLAFIRAPLLTLLILAALPLLTALQSLSHRLAGPLLTKERAATARAGSILAQAVKGIATVKAFSAAPREEARIAEPLDDGARAARRLACVWGATAACAQLATLAMFVQGFWFGGVLVRARRVHAGDVMAVFWACLIAASNLQMAVQRLVVVGRGAAAAAALSAAIADADAEQARARPGPMGGVTPQRACHGALELCGVSFTYPGAAAPALDAVSVFIPAGETTYVVGASGSGKSTLAALALGLYTPDAGTLLLDDQDVRYLSPAWVRAHIAGVVQGAGWVAPGSVYDNIALAAAGGPPSQEDEQAAVGAAARLAMVEEFARGLPAGLDTPLAAEGAAPDGADAGVALSGGQKQRLALARARMRDPTVLVLDEATSALDPPTRALVHLALRAWRRGRTTVVVTHDLAPIQPADFVYVMKGGRVVEQGFRADLEKLGAGVGEDGEEGEFRRMVRMGGDGGLEERDRAQEESLEQEDDHEAEDEDTEEEDAALYTPDPAADARGPFALARFSLPAPPSLRPLSLSSWMFDAVRDLTRARSPAPPVPPVPPLPPYTRYPDEEHDWKPDGDEGDCQRDCDLEKGHRRRPSSTMFPLPSPPAPAAGKRWSLPWAPASPTSPARTHPHPRPSAHVEDDAQFDAEKDAVQRSGKRAAERRGGAAHGRGRAIWGAAPALAGVRVHRPPGTQAEADDAREQPLGSLLRDMYAALPSKPLLFLGLVLCAGSGAATPVFSFLLSRLLFLVSAGDTDARALNPAGALVLAAAVLDAALLGGKYLAMERTGAGWARAARAQAVRRVLAQPAAWFDAAPGARGPARLVQRVVKDADDARALVGVVLAQGVVVGAMLGVGLVWALVRGWQLTLVGAAVAPVFAVTMAVQAGLVAQCERRNKVAREEVASCYYQTISNIRAIRALSLDAVFRARFDAAADAALKAGMRGALVEGCTYGVASALIYLAEAVLFYAGAALIARGTYTYLRMVEVLNLVVFTVTIGSQLMAFTQRTAKALQAARDVNRLMRLPLESTETKGDLTPVLSGDVSFEDVTFAYPSRPHAPVLSHLTFSVRPGECVALVGASGSGKSTVATLLQRLYEPQAGTVRVGGHDAACLRVDYLREKTAVVSQHAHLLDASVAANIAYGAAPSAPPTPAEIRSAAARADAAAFIDALPGGFDARVGEDAVRLSGGQAQRLQLARALVRRGAAVRVLDECTSALDAGAQARVLAALRADGVTTLLITHKVHVMRMCDRVLVLRGGAVVEEGAYEELMARNGVFADLARGGEWVAE